MAGVGGPILAVDDDDGILGFLSEVLAEEGHEVITAPHGAAALEVVARRAPSLILLDMRMPVMDGWAFARAYRERPGPHAPIVVFTAARNAEERAWEIAADAYLAKPFGLDELIDLVERLAPGA